MSDQHNTGAVPATTTESREHANRVTREANEKQAERAEKAKAAAVKGVDERTAVKDKQVAEYYERKASEKPTPTQRECDLARVGALDLDDKEPDGSESEAEQQRRVMQGNVDNPYNTRSMDNDGNGNSRRAQRSR